MKLWGFLIIILLIFDLQSKIKELTNKIDNTYEEKNKSRKNSKSIMLDEYIGKQVSLEIDNDDINNSYLFSGATIGAPVGEIVGYDNVWIVFKYYDKSKKKYINQYFRRRDIISINEYSKEWYYGRYYYKWIYCI